MPMTPKNWRSGEYSADVNTAIITEPCVLASVVIANTSGADQVSVRVSLVDADDALLAVLDIADVGPNSTRVLPGRSLSIMSGQRLAFQASAEGAIIYATGVVSDSFNETDPRLQYATASEVSQSIQQALEGYATNEGVDAAIETALQNYQPETDMAAVQDAIDASVRELQGDIEAQSSAAICLIPNRQFDRVDDNGVPAGWRANHAVVSRDWHLNHYDATLAPTGGGIPSLATTIKNARFLGSKALRMSAEVSANAGTNASAIVAAADGRGAFMPARVDRQTISLDFTPDVTNPLTHSLDPSFSILPMTTATKRADMPSKRYAHMMAASPDAIYVYGGRDDGFNWSDSNSSKSDLLRLNKNTGTWEQLPSVDGPGPLSGGIMSYRDGALYLYSGTTDRSSANTTDIMWKYDLSQKTWQQLGNTPFSAFWMGGAVGSGSLDGLLIAAGGYANGRNLNRIYIYRIDSNEWLDVGTMPYTANNSGLSVYDGKLYLMGGFQSGTFFKNAYRGTISEAEDGSGPVVSWVRIDDMPTARTTFGIDVDREGGRIFVYGGNTPDGIVGSVSVLMPNMPDGQMWVTVDSPGVPAARFAGLSYSDGRLFATGGYTGSERLPDAWSVRTFRGLQAGQQFHIPDAGFLVGGTTDAELIIGAPCLAERSTVTNEVHLTRAEYDALTDYDPNTHYIVQE